MKLKASAWAEIAGLGQLTLSSRDLATNAVDPVIARTDEWAKLMRYVFLTTLAVSTLSMPLRAATLVQDGGWSSTLFNGVGDPILDSVTNDAVWTFSVVGFGELRITDSATPGDVFQLTINGVMQPSTSMPGAGPIIADPDASYAGGYFSRGAYVLSAGAYTVTGIATVSPFGIGNGYIGLFTTRAGAVPELATWAMMLSGFGLIGSTLRYRRRKTTVRFA